MALRLPDRIVAGLMTGTSADGIDVAIVKMNAKVNPHTLEVLDVGMEMVAAETVEWSARDRARILDAMATHGSVSLAAVGKLSKYLAIRLADAVTNVASLHSVHMEQIDAIACHGQTICHSPPHSSLQIGEPSVLAARTGRLVVSDFRSADLAVGGQGAPITSTMDYMMLRPPASMGGWRAVQNIGGIANVTFLPPQGSDAPPLAFDTGPGNVLIDMAAEAATSGPALPHPPAAAAGADVGGSHSPAMSAGKSLEALDVAVGSFGCSSDVLDASGPPSPASLSRPDSPSAAGFASPPLAFDKDGLLAAKGTVCAAVLDTMLQHEYLGLPPPKTTGRETFTRTQFEEWNRIGLELGATPEDMVATVTEFTAVTIARAYKEYCPGALVQVVVGGGGCRNPTLMRRLWFHLEALYGHAVEVVSHEAIGVDSDAKEAVAFALLGYLAMHGIPNNTPACTGASRPVVMGKFSIPPPSAEGPRWNLTPM